MNLTEMEMDVLKEAFNVGAGRAAASLEELVSDDRELQLSVPEVEMISIDDLDRAVCEEGNQFCGVVQSFESLR